MLDAAETLWLERQRQLDLKATLDVGLSWAAAMSAMKPTDVLEAVSEAISLRSSNEAQLLVLLGQLDASELSHEVTDALGITETETWSLEEFKQRMLDKAQEAPE